MKKGVILDLDGTLIDAKNQVIGGSETVALIRKLQEMQVRMAIITGRLDHDIVKIDEKLHLNIDERVSENGAVIYSGQRMSAVLLEKEEALQINSFLKEWTDVRVELNTVDRRYWLCERDPQFPRELFDSSVLVNDYEDVIRYQPAVLFLVVGETETLRRIQVEIKMKFHQVDAIMTSSSSLEIVPQHVSKGMAMHSLFADETVYAVGDSESDISMKQYAERFYYVGGKECQGAILKPTIKEALEDVVYEINRTSTGRETL